MYSGELRYLIDIQDTIVYTVRQRITMRPKTVQCNRRVAINQCGGSLRPQQPCKNTFTRKSPLCGIHSRLDKVKHLRPSQSFGGFPCCLQPPTSVLPFFVDHYFSSLQQLLLHFQRFNMARDAIVGRCGRPPRGARWSWGRKNSGIRHARE